MRKEEKTEITKEKLLAATEKLIKQGDDPFKVTSRQIAEAAEVQAAMINYCFGSRENLIYQIFERDYKEAVTDPKVAEIISSKTLTPKEKLKALHFKIARFLIKEYKFTKAVTNFVVFKRDLSKEAFSLKYVREHFDGRKTEEECRLIAYELSTMMQLIIYRKDDIKDGFGIDLNDDAQLKHYVDMRVDLLLGD